MNVQIDYALIGRRIRDHRRQAQLTQAELAERAGVCQQYIGCLELGKGIPSLATVLSLCSALAVDPNSLLLGCAKENPEAPCTLRDIPPIYSDTLASLWMQHEGQPVQIGVSFNPAAFPPVDITLDDAGSCSTE